MGSYLLIRHAQAEHHVADLTGGWTDTHLTEQGYREAALLAERLRRDLNGTPRRLLCSDLKRGIQTAEVIGAALHLPVHVRPELRDMNNGIAAGMPRSQARRLVAAQSEPLADWLPFPQGETWRQFYRRVEAFLNTIHSQEEAEITLLVSHASTLHVVLAWWLGLGPDSRTHFGFAPASLGVLRMSRWGERSVERLNDTTHLAAAGFSRELRL